MKASSGLVFCWEYATELANSSNRTTDRARTSHLLLYDIRFLNESDGMFLPAGCHASMRHARVPGASNLMDKGEWHGCFRLDRIPNLWTDLYAGASVLRCAWQPGVIPHAASRRQRPHQAAAVLPRRRPRIGAQRDRKRLRVPQGQIRRRRARRDQEDRAQDGQSYGDSRVREAIRGRPHLLRVVVLLNAGRSWP